MVFPVQNNVSPIETVPQETDGKVESIAPVEVQPTTRQYTPSDQESTVLNQKSIQTPSTKKTDQSVVDKSKTKTRLHPLNSPDTLTTIADKEEEEFITEVEAAHDEHH